MSTPVACTVTMCLMTAPLCLAFGCVAISRRKGRASHVGTKHGLNLSAQAGGCLAACVLGDIERVHPAKEGQAITVAHARPGKCSRVVVHASFSVSMVLQSGDGACFVRVSFGTKDRHSKTLDITSTRCLQVNSPPRLPPLQHDATRRCPVCVTSCSPQYSGDIGGSMCLAQCKVQPLQKRLTRPVFGALQPHYYCCCTTLLYSL